MCSSKFLRRKEYTIRPEQTEIETLIYGEGAGEGALQYVSSQKITGQLT